jgi:hypothetical protein
VTVIGTRSPGSPGPATSAAAVPNGAGQSPVRRRRSSVNTRRFRVCLRRARSRRSRAGRRVARRRCLTRHADRRRALRSPRAKR